MSKELDRSRPLWEVHVKEDYDSEHSIVFMVIHHIIGDGMAVMSMMTHLNDSHNPTLNVHRSVPFLYQYLIPLLYIPMGIFRITKASLL